jgi:hypothetical protein
MDSTGKTTDTTLEDVDTLLTSITGQMASLQLQLNQGTGTARHGEYQYFSSWSFC